jgi:hypothetical protein
VAASSAPMRVSRTIVGGGSNARVVTLDRSSSITYDAREHRFVNAASAPSSAEAKSGGKSEGVTAREALTGERIPQAGTVGAARGPAASARVPAASARAVAPPSRAMAPPPRPYSGGSSGGWSQGAASRASSGASSSHTSAGSTSASHPSASASGGRPH